ncbi:MAG: TadE family protein [Candidatus Nanopelagicales bacterium]
MVTVEVALALPILILAAMAMVGVLAAGQTQVRLTDVARATARESARGAAPADAVAVGHRIDPHADIRLDSAGDTITVTARRTITGPGPVLAGWERTVVATATTTAEDPS